MLTQFPERDPAFSWELPVKDMGNDAVVGIYWPLQELRARATRTVGYGYGAGAVTTPMPGKGDGK